MKRILNQLLWELAAVSFFILLLMFSKDCIAYASEGLLIWYRSMIPALFPFMILSGFMVRSGLSSKIGNWMQPFLGLFFRLPSEMLYTIFMGFLCGFPMGAKTIADMLHMKKLTLKQGEYLLAFCNNIGPLYMIGYVIPLFQYHRGYIVLGFLYLIPLLYGLYLRYFHADFFELPPLRKSRPSSKLYACEGVKTQKSAPDYLESFRLSLTNAIEQITLLGGCMIFFNCLLIFPQLLCEIFSNYINSKNLHLFHSICCCLLEIGGGLQQLSSLRQRTFPEFNTMFLTLSLLTLGGVSCMMQTCFIIKNTGLKISTYIKHKFIQSCFFFVLFIILIL